MLGDEELSEFRLCQRCPLKIISKSVILHHYVPIALVRYMSRNRQASRTATLYTRHQPTEDNMKKDKAKNGEAILEIFEIGYTEEYTETMAAIDAAIEEEEIKRATEAGVCRHCGQDIEDCPGYKCWM